MTALLEAGASTELPPPPPDAKQFDLFTFTKDSPLIQAAKQGHEVIVRKLLDAGAKLDSADRSGMTALDWAEKNAHASIVALLRGAAGVSADTLDGQDLLRAAKQGDVDTILRALAAGVDVDFCDKPTADASFKTIPGRTALMHAAVAGHVDSARELLNAGASLNLQQLGLASQFTAVELAACHNQSAILHLMLNSPAPPSKKLLESATVEAARRDALDALRLLLDAGVKVDVRGSSGETPLIAAAGVGYDAVVRHLLERGAKPDLKDGTQFGSFALDSAIVHLGIFQRERDTDGKSILTQTGNARNCVRLLLAAGADPNLERKDGEVPLALTVRYPDVVAILLDAGADVNYVLPRDQTTALYWATAFQVPDSVRLLLAAGADPNTVNREGKTPLDFARDRKYDEIVAMLVAAHAKSASETNEGRQRQADIADAKRHDELRHQQAAEADKRLRPDFSKALGRANFKKAMAKLEALCATKPQHIEQVPGLAYCTIRLDQAKSIWEAEFEKFQKLGAYLFRFGRAFMDDDDELLAILPTADQFKVIAAIGTAAPNYDMSMSDVIAGLHKIYEMTAFRIKKVTFDNIEGDFTVPIGDVKAMAKFLYEFCPDIVDQGVGTLRKLEQTLKKQPRLYLWWD